MKSKDLITLIERNYNYIFCNEEGADEILKKILRIDNDTINLILKTKNKERQSLILQLACLESDITKDDMMAIINATKVKKGLFSNKKNNTKETILQKDILCAKLSLMDNNKTIQEEDIDIVRGRIH